MTLIRRTILVLVALACATSPASADGDPRVPTIDDLLNVDSIGGARISPNGKWVAYSVMHSDFKKDAFLTHLWLAEPASGRRFQLTRGDKSAGGMAWSPDSAWLAFTSNRAGDKNQIFAVPPDGGEALQLTKAETGVAGRQKHRVHRRTVEEGSDEEPQGALRRFRGRTQGIRPPTPLDHRRSRSPEGTTSRQAAHQGQGL